MMQMIKKKSRINAKTKREKIVFDGFSNYDKGEKGKLVATESKNCDCYGGVLTTGLGIKDYVLPDGEIAVPASTVQALGIVILDSYDSTTNEHVKQIYYNTQSGYTGCYDYTDKRFKLKLYTSPGTKIVRYRNSQGIEKVVHAGTKGIICYKQDSGATSTYTKAVKPIICVHSNRIFIVKDDRTLLYNSPGSENSFSDSSDDSGSILCDVDSGAIVGLAGLGRYLYIFFERSVFRMKVEGSARDFALEKLPYYGNNIIGESAGAVGKYIVFLAYDGLWRIDSESKNIVRICEKLPVYPSRQQPYVFHVTVERQYCLYYNDDKIKGYKTIAIYPEEDNEGYELFNMDVMSETDGKALCSDGYQFFEYDSAYGPPPWENCTFKTETDFGYPGKKTLRKVTIEAEGLFNFFIRTDYLNMKNTLQMTGKKEISVFEQAEKFQFYFVLGIGAKIKKITAEIERVGGET